MDPSLLQRLWPVFAEETREHLQQIAAGVLELEKGTAADGTLHGIRRTAHGLKGSAASLGLSDIEKLAHAMETALAGRTEKNPLEARRVEALLAGIAAAEAALGRGDIGQEPRVDELAGLLAALSGETPEGAKVPRTGRASPASPVFPREVIEHLARLRQAFDPARAGEGWTTDEAAALTRAAATLRAAASELGAAEMEASSARLQGQLAMAGTHPTTARLTALQSIAMEIEEVLNAGSSLGPNPPAPPEDDPTDTSPLAVFRREALDSVQTLERSLQRLCSPASDAERAQVVEEAERQARNLTGSARAVGVQGIADVAARLEASISRMFEPGTDASRAVATAAEDVVSLKRIVEEIVAQRPAADAASEKPAESAPAVMAIAPASDRTVRVSVNTLESLARQMESFTLVRAREERRARELAAHSAAVQEIRQMCEHVLEELRHASQQSHVAVLDEALGRLRTEERSLLRMGQEHAREAEQIRLVSTVVREDLRDLRMVPASTALEPLRRTVREVAGRLKKQVELTLHGGEVRLDRRILEELKDPLQHLVRNAIDHGLESPETRTTLGKRPVGALEVRVERRGRRIAVLVQDDGAGISVDRIRQTALRHGLITAPAAARLSNEETLRLIFQPGFSTAEQVTSISGRGVGLDVVQAAAFKLRGTVDLSTTPGQGTRFVLDLPLTLAATLAVVVRAGSDLAAVPYETVERILRITSKDLGTVAGNAAAQIEGIQVPFTALSHVVGEDGGGLSLDSAKVQPAILVNSGGTRIVFAIDEVIGQHEVVVQSLGKHLARTSHLAGAAVLEDGRVVSVLNVAELVRLARPLTRRAAEEARSARVLVVDDSLTTRSAMKALLEIAGYQVLAACDGEEALGLLQHTPCNLLVTDIQMPRMDGLDLTRRVKSDPALAKLPVIVVTSLDSPADRAAGLEAGADGYLVKKDVERGKLLELVHQLLPAQG